MESMYTSLCCLFSSGLIEVKWFLGWMYVKLGVEVFRVDRIVDLILLTEWIRKVVCPKIFS